MTKIDPEQLPGPTLTSDLSVPPRLAVIISCYNYADFVQQAIQSVLDQKRNDCELVVVDDGSIDGSWDVISRTGVTAFRLANGGQLAACRFGLDKTKAPFILFLDADDTLKPGALSIILDRLDSDVAKLQFPLTLIDTDGNAITGAAASLESYRERDTLTRLVLETGVYKSPPTSGNVFRRDLCKLLHEVDYDRAVDGVILFAAPFFGDVISISEPLGCYRIHSRNDSGLGRMPDAKSLQRDIQRFEARMVHLQAIIKRTLPNADLVKAQKTFYYRDRSLYFDIASGRQPSLLMLPGLILTLADIPFTRRNKVAMAVFFLLVTILPNKRSKALLAYRLKTGNRSAFGLVKSIFN